MKLPIVEQFGPTIQGEGPYAGRLAYFVRFGGCNLSCLWCDTAYSWDASRFDLRAEISAQSPTDIVAAIDESANIVVLTGGEPMLYAKHAEFEELVTDLVERGIQVHVETNGTILPPTWMQESVSVFVISPKLSNAGPHKRGQNPEIAPGWTEISGRVEAHLKFVCRDEGDVEDAVREARRLCWNSRNVWVMPEGANAEVLSERWPAVLEAAIMHGVNATTRLHILAWGTRRGV